MTKPSKLVAAIGIPGSGKSSVLDCLAKLHGAKIFHEPEEEDWPDAVKKRDICGYITAITWFRSMRVPQLFEAAIARDKYNETVFVDSYFDKLIFKYLGNPGLEWLIPPADPYYPLVREIAALDFKKLPNADVLIAFRVVEDVWHHFIRVRNRQLDQYESFKQDCFKLQNHMLRAAEEFCLQNKCDYVLFNQEISSPKEAALKLDKLLKGKNIIL